MQLEFHRDAEGAARARCKGRGQAVAGFLESDLQESPSAAQEILRALDEVESDENDPVLEQPGIDIVAPFAPAGLTAAAPPGSAPGTPTP